MSATQTRPIPRAAGWPLVGSAASMAAGPHRFVAELGHKHGGLAAFRVFHRRFVAVSSAEYVRQILVTEHQRYRRSYHYRNPVIGDGLLTTDGPGWLKRRRQVNVAFRRDTLERLVPVTREETERLLDRWTTAAREGRPIPVVEEMQQLAVTTIGRALLSAEVGSGEAIRFAATVREALRMMRRRNNSPLPVWAPGIANRALNSARDTLDAFLRPIIAARRDRPGSRGDLLDALLAVRDPETGDALDDQEVLDEAKTLFAAGFETTSTALSWTLHLLATHPDVAADWHAELDREIGSSPPGWPDLARLQHLGRVMNESLRLYPPVYTLARECIEPDTVDGYAIPRGTILLLSVLGVHHDGRLWPDPETFRPDRFASDWPRHAYLPFATGQHVCIGNSFALTEMAVALAMIGQRFRLEPIDPAPVEASAYLTLVPAREIYVRLEPRSVVAT